MPNNIKSLIVKLQRKAKLKSDEYNRTVQIIAAGIIFEELMRVTPVISGRLAGNYELLTDRAGGRFRPRRFNGSRTVSAENLIKILAITGKDELRIQNLTPYAEKVNLTSRRNSKYFERALLAAKNRLKVQGITLTL